MGVCEWVTGRDRETRKCVTSVCWVCGWVRKGERRDTLLKIWPKTDQDKTHNLHTYIPTYLHPTYNLESYAVKDMHIEIAWQPEKKSRGTYGRGGGVYHLDPNVRSLHPLPPFIPTSDMHGLYNHLPYFTLQPNGPTRSCYLVICIHTITWVIIIDIDFLVCWNLGPKKKEIYINNNRIKVHAF